MVADDEVRVIHLRDEMRVTALLRDSHALADQARVHVGDRTLGGRNNGVRECARMRTEGLGVVYSTPFKNARTRCSSSVAAFSSSSGRLLSAKGCRSPG